MKADSNTDSTPTPGNLIVISGPSGVGKSMLVAALVNADQGIVESVSYTTRPPRANEIDGRHYHFIDDIKFEALVRSNAFLEHAAIYGYRYGTAQATVDQLLQKGKDVVLQIDWQGRCQVRERGAPHHSIFILPPSHEALHRRLHARAQDSAATISTRLDIARSDISRYDEFDYLVVNDDFAQAVADLRAIARAIRLQRAQQAIARQTLIQALLNAG